MSPKYNHAMIPALANLLNHFGSSLFSYKTSVIATYSAGQWGGARDAVGMREYLSELGFLPVSAMIHSPKAPWIFDAGSRFLTGIDADGRTAYINRPFAQLELLGGSGEISPRNGGLGGKATAVHARPVATQRALL